MKLPLNQIIQGDCLEVLKTFPSNSVDLVVTSPPYNLGNNHHTGSKSHKSYDDSIPEKEYQEQQTTLLNELHRVLKDDGSLFYNHKNRINKGICITPYQWILKSKLILKQEVVWFNGSQNFDKIRFYPMTERVYWLVKKSETRMINSINHHDLFKWKAVGTKGKHTRAFPEEMVKDILSCFNDAEIVLDPYMGSGTTAKVAKEMGRNFVGIELNQEFIKMAEDKLKQETLFNPIGEDK